MEDASHAYHAFIAYHEHVTEYNVTDFDKNCFEMDYLSNKIVEIYILLTLPFNRMYAPTCELFVREAVRVLCPAEAVTFWYNHQRRALKG